MANTRYINLMCLAIFLFMPTIYGITEEIKCHGKDFRCFNKTSFYICIDNGGTDTIAYGEPQTCLEGLECRDSAKIECGDPLSVTTPESVEIAATGAINQLIDTISYNTPGYSSTSTTLADETITDATVDITETDDAEDTSLSSTETPISAIEVITNSNSVSDSGHITDNVSTTTSPGTSEHVPDDDVTQAASTLLPQEGEELIGTFDTSPQVAENTGAREEPALSVIDENLEDSKRSTSGAEETTGSSDLSSQDTANTDTQAVSILPVASAPLDQTIENTEISKGSSSEIKETTSATFSHAIVGSSDLSSQDTANTDAQVVSTLPVASAPLDQAIENIEISDGSTSDIKDTVSATSSHATENISKQDNSNLLLDDTTIPSTERVSENTKILEESESEVEETTFDIFSQITKNTSTQEDSVLSTTNTTGTSTLSEQANENTEATTSGVKKTTVTQDESTLPSVDIASASTDQANENTVKSKGSISGAEVATHASDTSPRVTENTDFQEKSTVTPLNITSAQSDEASGNIVNTEGLPLPVVISTENIGIQEGSTLEQEQINENNVPSEGATSSQGAENSLGESTLPFTGQPTEHSATSQGSSSFVGDITSTSTSSEQFTEEGLAGSLVPVEHQVSAAGEGTSSELNMEKVSDPQVTTSHTDAISTASQSKDSKNDSFVNSEDTTLGSIEKSSESIQKGLTQSPAEISVSDVSNKDKITSTSMASADGLLEISSVKPETIALPVQETTSVPSAPEFVCTTPGRFSHETDCSAYHLCINIGLTYYKLTLNCPSSTEFDPNKLVCSITPNVCSKGFKCIAEGVYPDANNDAKFLMCIYNPPRNNYIQKQIDCPEHFKFDKILRKCILQESPLQSSEDCDECSESEEFMCTSVGRFPVEGNCEEYYSCSLKKNEYKVTLKKCSSKKYFDDELRKCRSKELVNCSYSSEEN